MPLKRAIKLSSEMIVPEQNPKRLRMVTNSARDSLHASTRVGATKSRDKLIVGLPLFFPMEKFTSRGHSYVGKHHQYTSMTYLHAIEMLIRDKNTEFNT